MNTMPDKNLQAENRSSGFSGSPAPGGDMLLKLRDRAVFLGWIAGLVVAGALIWSLTQPVRERALMRAVNRVLILREDPRRLSAPLAAPPGEGLFGSWYSLLNSDSSFFVFAVMRDGILVPCGAQVSGEGKVEEIIPLGAHAGQVSGSLSQGILQIYIRRIENTAAGRGK
ncbi:MAG: hypothetical protein LBJ90_00645 [Treponema sp.]|jgi:hypothetical protein|nr:hypothetical protein [Treponema sp.]